MDGGGEALAPGRAPGSDPFQGMTPVRTERCATFGDPSRMNFEATFDQLYPALFR